MPEPTPEPTPEPSAEQALGTLQSRGRRRLGFPGTVGLGLAGSGLAAIAGNRAWADVAHTSSFAGTEADVLASIDQAKAPLVTAVALVALAAWGVLLVTRGRFRRVVAWVGVLAGLGVVAAAVAAYVESPGSVRDAVGALDQPVHRTVWSYLALVAAVAALVAALGAVRGVRSWPEMGRRYDAPTDRAGGAAADPGAGGTGAGDGAVETPRLEEQQSIDIWKTIDQGVDPTEDPRT